MVAEGNSMRPAGEGDRRWAAVFLLLFFLVTCAPAEEGILVLQVVDARHHPFANVRIALGGEGGSPQNSDQNGRMRLRLAPNTKPFAWATLLLKGGPGGLDLTFVSPFSEPARVRVPPFENDQDNFEEVIVVKEGDKEMLEHGSGRLAVEAAAKPAPKSQYRPLFGEPRLVTVALRLGPQGRSESAATYPMPEAAMLAAAKRFGLSLADIKAAIAFWGGSPLVWKSIMMTASIEAGGTDPFPYVQATSNDIVFGAGSWSLRGCGLQPALLKFQERNPQRFAEIVGKEDAEWLGKTLSAPCEASSSMVLERMLEGPGALRHSWREKFRQLGNEPALQHLQVEQIARSLKQAQGQASALGMTSDQAIAFCSYVATQAGTAMIPSQQQGFMHDVEAFKQQIGREPDEQERLLMLANRVDTSLKAAVPQFPPLFLEKVALLSGGEGTVLGFHYDLDDFGIGLTDSTTGAQVPVHHDKETLPRLASGWVPSQPASSQTLTPTPPAPGPPTIRQPSSDFPAGTQFDAPGEAQLVDLINQERTRRGIPPVQVDPRLTQTSRRHSVQMAQHRTISHQVPGEPPLGSRYTEMDLRSSFNGQNIALGDSVPSAHRRLMNDPEHRDIILNPNFNSVGTAVLISGGALYVTEDFAQVQQNYTNDEAARAVQDAIATYALSRGLPAPVPKPQPQLQDLARNLAQTHALDAQAIQGLPGVRNVVAWATTDLKQLPSNVTAAISRPMSGYSVGVCFAPDARIYWIVMVTY
jgi:uncharacterized protein YkwD